jgi:heavy metal-binding protein
MTETPNPAAYICPMHAQVRETRPGRCPECGMNLVPEGARFKILRHMLGSPVHLTIMAGIMVAVMAAAMMMMR